MTTFRDMTTCRTVIACFDRSDPQELERVVSDYVSNLENGNELLYGMDGLPLLRITWLTNSGSLAAFIEARVRA